MQERREILTVGHSNHDEGRFLELLGGAGIEAIADVRAQPGSRRHPHFNADALAASLKASGFGYEAFGVELGGRREPLEGSPNVAWDDDAFRGYADHMASPEFANGLGRLEQLAAAKRTAVMCAEGDWQSCHRRLIADALTVRGWRVLHLGTEGSLDEHRLDERAVRDGDRLTYPMPGQTVLEI